MQSVTSLQGAKQLTFVVLFAALLFLAGCGGYNNGGSNPPGSPGNTTTIVSVGDAPADRVISFEITVSSVTLVRSDNATYASLTGPRRLEVTHLSGSAEPLVLTAIPQGTYNSASISLSAPEVVYIDNAGNKVEKSFPNATFNLTIPFNPALVVGTSPVALTLDVDVSRSVVIDTVTGNVTVNPTLSITQAQVPAANHENESEPENGEFEHIVGQVTAASANSFSISVASSGATLTFKTDTTTQVEGAANTAALPLNSTVRVEGFTRADGTAFAKEVEVVSMNGQEIEGLITATTGRPVTSFDMVVQDGNVSGLSATALGNTRTVTVSNNVRFRVDSGKIDLSGLNLPTFNATNLSKGQRVEAESDNAQAGATLTADSIKLQSQALVGVISAATATQFTLTIADDSAFKLLTGKNTLTVVTQRNTRLKNGVAIGNTAVVKVRGLVFFDSVSGNYTMVAGRVTTP